METRMESPRRRRSNSPKRKEYQLKKGPIVFNPQTIGDEYRSVLYTTPQVQLVVLTLNPGENIGYELHHSTTQITGVASGVATVVVSGMQGDELKYNVREGEIVFIPPNFYHDFINETDKPLKLWTIYNPPEYHPNLVQITKPGTI